ncbi:MAG: hypothetical protein ACYSTX_03870 [Planctomycetota bacterium]|jgi:hypothetical protein
MYKFNLLRISILVSLILLLSLTISFGQEQKVRKSPLEDLIRQRMQKKGNAQTQRRNAEAEEEVLEEELQEVEGVVETADPNKPVDPFLIIDREGKNESREWIFGTQEGRLLLSKRVQGQVLSELNYIRKAAEVEGATQTIEAIDRVIANRNQRFDGIAKRIREERAKATQDQAVNPRQNVRGRGTTGTGRGGRGSTGTGRGATRGQQEPGPRGRMYQGQGQQSTRGGQNGY